MFSISSWQVIFEAEVSGGRSGYIAIDDIQVLSYPCGRLWLRILFYFVLSNLSYIGSDCWMFITWSGLSLLLSLLLAFCLVLEEHWSISRVFDSNSF